MAKALWTRHEKVAETVWDEIQRDMVDGQKLCVWPALTEAEQKFLK